MPSADSRLHDLARKVSRRKKLLAIKDDLSRQIESLSQRVEELDRIRLKEQGDVDDLERTCLSRLFYQFVGTLEEKLDQEITEAIHAALQYESANTQLQALQRDLEACTKELDLLSGCEQAYQVALEEKAREWKACDPAHAGPVCLLEEEIGRLEAQAQEIREAISAGESAMVCVSYIQNELSSAEGWGTWDFVGGGLFSDLAKHSHLDDAQQQLYQLQIDLRRFRTELLDVDVSADFQISIDGFLRFADYFFDGLFADWAVLDHIHSAQQQVNRIDDQIQQVLERLRYMQNTNRQKVKTRRQQLEELLLSVPR